MSKQTANPALLQQINELFRTLAALIRRQVSLRLDYDRDNDRRKAEFDRENSALEQEISEKKDELAGLVEGHRAELVTGRLKGFATQFASFSFREVPTKFKVTDKQAALAAAKKLGVMRKVCSIKVTYVVDAEKLQKYLDTHPEYIEDFADYVEQPHTSESLSVKPNETFHATHDTERLTNQSIKLA